tara:strand:+ start:413 stop:685 length:273 start_codon:yes stop_codon:yes gene_type:complete
MSQNKKLYSNLAIYIPKHESNFFKICKEFVKKKFPGRSFSWFIIETMKNYVNSLPKNDKDLFESCAMEMAKKDKPKASSFVDKFIKGGSV